MFRRAPNDTTQNDGLDLQYVFR